jgi:hypothetical protein
MEPVMAGKASAFAVLAKLAANKFQYGSLVVSAGRSLNSGRVMKYCAKWASKLSSPLVAEPQRFHGDRLT